MQRIFHGTLVYFSLDLLGGPQKFQEILATFPQEIRLVGLSSIYKRYHGFTHVDINAKMEFVAKLVTEFEVQNFLEVIRQACREIQMTVLAFDDLVLMSPSLTLPYPDLHTDPLIIRCAAEAWDLYEHPIFQKTLNEISRNAQPITDAEFYLQGRSLVDI